MHERADVPPPATSDQVRLPLWRYVLMTIGAVSAAAFPYIFFATFSIYTSGFSAPDIGLGAFIKEMPALMLWGCLLLLLSGVLATGRRVFWQIVARATWWWSVVVGGGMTGLTVWQRIAFEQRGELSSFLVCGLMALCGGLLALWAAGPVRWDERSRFAPAAFRFSLTASLIMSLADMHTLLVLSDLPRALSLGSWWSDNGLTAICGLVMGLAVLGVYRLRLWGVALNLVANVLIAALALTGTLRLPDLFTYTLAATAALQLLIPLPMLRMIFQRRRDAARAEVVGARVEADEAVVMADEVDARARGACEVVFDTQGAPASQSQAHTAQTHTAQAQIER